jgi:hypothetical protein
VRRAAQLAECNSEQAETQQQQAGRAIYRHGVPQNRTGAGRHSARRPNLAALQLLNHEPEAFDLRLRLSEVGAFGRERPDHPLQRLHIVWQIGTIDVYEPAVYADSRPPRAINMPLSQSAAVIIPPRPVATAARVRASRRRQSALTTAPSSASASRPCGGVLAVVSG